MSSKEGKTSAGRERLISASDIEKFGYCPLSWYISYQKKLEGSESGDVDMEPDIPEFEEDTEQDEKEKAAREALKKGEEAHEEASEELDTIMQKQGELESTRISWIAFIVISALVALNGGLILALIYYQQDSRIISWILAGTSLLWIGVSIYYFISLVLTERRLKWPLFGLWRFMISKPKVKPVKTGELRRRDEFFKLALILMVIASVLLFNAGLYYFDVDPSLAQNILIVLALVWLLATSVFLFIGLRESEHIPIYKNKVVIGFSLVGFIFLCNAFIINRLDIIKESDQLTLVFGFIAVVWLLVSLFILNLAFSESFRIHHNIKRIFRHKTKIFSVIVQRLGQSEIEERVKRHEKGVLYFGVISIFLGLNSFIVGINPNIDIAYILEIIALIWLIGAAFLLFINLNTQREMFRLKEIYKIGREAKVAYTDTQSAGKGVKKARLFISREHGVSGRPDIILENENGEMIPVEIKTGRVPRGPYFSHILQIAAYGLVLEEEYGTLPPYGLVKYGPKGDEKEFRVDFNEDLMKLLKEKIELMREGMRTGDVHRNHKRKGKCYSCSRRGDCSESLA